MDCFAPWLVAGVVLCLLTSTDALADDAWTRAQEKLYRGPRAHSVADLAPYTGRAAADRLVGDDRAEAYRLNQEQLGINYGPNVEAQLRDELVILCPQTEAVLYTEFTPLTPRYRRGDRPELDALVGRLTAGCRTDRERALALMRFCRDLRRQAPDADFTRYVYGGTEEQMVAKPEILCETLSRLHVALCEVAGLPGRLVMHILGGHITTEIYVEGGWAYMDPRCGMYFVKPDGHLASLRELWRNPALVGQQSPAVRADASAQWGWDLRARKCETMYFSPLEVNGLENYSLADATRYHYGQRPYAEAKALGLFTINERYVRTAQRALGLAPEAPPVDWSKQPLRKLDLAYRHDGFSPFYTRPPFTRRTLEERYVDPLAGSNAGLLVWGLGPGSVFCYETKVGEVFGEGLDERQRGLLREGDLWVHENVMGLIREGPGPLRMAVERAHAVGLKLLARLEMNHEYGPAAADNWMWVAFVGRLNKEHPEYRIPGRVLLDFKHPEVRAFKLAIFREALEAEADGLELDLAVYPPFFEQPDPATMTSFLREVRQLLDEFGARRGKHLDMMVRVPAYGYAELGLDWPTWLREHLVDIIVPTHLRPGDYFDIRVEDFVKLGAETGVKVYPTEWQALGFVDTDQRPGDEATGRRRYDKPKTKGMYFAQALLFHRAGADGLQLGFSEDQWRHMPWLNDLADPEQVLTADKHYMVDPIALRAKPFAMTDAAGGQRGECTVGLRLGDDIPGMQRRGYTAKAEVVIYCRPLETGERLELTVNGQGPLTISGDAESEQARRGAQTVDPRTARDQAYIFEAEWWRRGEHRLPADAAWWRLGPNDLRLVYTRPAQTTAEPLSITWIDLILTYAH
ncbi:hypothetical protein LLH23_02890 [bacterium]|nr:hypothetical protein [bacterium]